MSGRPRVGVVGVFHETNTFSPVRTDLAAFERRGVMIGGQWTSSFCGTRTVGGGFIDGAANHNLDLLAIFGTYATPSGLVTASTMHHLMLSLEEQLATVGTLDGVLLELHGSLVADGFTDAETEITALLRRHFPAIPIVAAVDLHANMRYERLDGADALVGYRTNPHIDTYECGVRAAALMNTAIRTGQRPVRAHAGFAVRVPPAAQGTADDPLADILAYAADLEAERRLLDITVHAGYAYADVPWAGMGVTATATPDMAAEARTAVEAVSDFAQQRVDRFARPLLHVPAAIRMIPDSQKPVVLADTGDNINGGAPGDGTWLLERLLTRTNCRTLAAICDPATYARAAAGGVGATLDASLGAWSGTRSGSALRGRATVERLGHGTFTNKGPMATGAVVSMHGAALVRVGPLDLVIQNAPVQPNDPELFRSMGVEPTSYDVIVLKGAAALRAAWSSIAGTILDVATPGPCDADLSRLTFMNS